MRRDQWEKNHKLFSKKREEKKSLKKEEKERKDHTCLNALKGIWESIKKDRKLSSAINNGKDKDAWQSKRHESKRGKNKDTQTEGWLQKGSRNSGSNCLAQPT